jgi:hypothetical protein
MGDSPGPELTRRMMRRGRKERRQRLQAEGLVRGGAGRFGTSSPENDARKQGKQAVGVASGTARQAGMRRPT